MRDGDDSAYSRALSFIREVWALNEKKEEWEIRSPAIAEEFAATHSLWVALGGKDFSMAEHLAAFRAAQRDARSNPQ